MDSDMNSEGVESPRLGTIEESSLENLILQYEEEVVSTQIKDLRFRLSQSRAPSQLVPPRNSLPKQRKSLEEISDLLALGDLEEASHLWRALGYPPMENERWEDVYKKLQQIALLEGQRTDHSFAHEQAKNFKLETELRSLKRSLRETESELEVLKANLPSGKRSQDPAEVIVLRMQMKALEEGIAIRDKDIADMATEVALVKSEEQRLKLIIENLKIEARTGEILSCPKGDSEDVSRLMQRIQDLSAENAAITKKIDHQNRLKAIIDEQTAVIRQLQTITEKTDPGSSLVPEALTGKIQSLEAELELEKLTRTETKVKLEDTIERLEASHSEETLKLTKQLTVSEGLAMQANMRLHGLEEQLTELLGKKSDNEREIYRAKETIEELEEQKESLLAEFERANRIVMEEKSVREALREEMEQISQKADELREENEGISRECSSLRSQVADFRAKNSALESELRENELKFDLQISSKQSEFAELRKLLETEKRQFEEKNRLISREISHLEAKLADIQREKEELRVDFDITNKKKDVLSDDYVRLSAAYEALQSVSKSQSESMQVEMSKMKEDMRSAKNDNQVLESRLRILEDTHESLERLTIEHSLIQKEHLKCESKLMKLRNDYEKEQEMEAKQRESAEKLLLDVKSKYHYILNAFRVRETEIMTLRIANQQFKEEIKAKSSDFEGNRRCKSSPHLANDPKDKQITALQSQLAAQEAIIAQLQQRLILSMSQRGESEQKSEHKQLIPTFPDQELAGNGGQVVNSLQKITVEWVNSLPEWIQKQLSDPQIDNLLDIPSSLDTFLDTLREKLTEIAEIMRIHEAPSLGFNVSKANQALDRLDRGQGPIELAVFLNFIIENQQLHQEILRKSEEIMENNIFFKQKPSEISENSKELWTIQRWHESEKESARLRTELLANVQRFDDFYRSKATDSDYKAENQRLIEEISEVKSAFGKNQTKLKEFEAKFEAINSAESQKSSYEGVISSLRSRLSKSESELEALKTSWERVIASLKIELSDFGGDYQPSMRDTPEMTLIGIVSALKSVRLGLNQHISDLEKRLSVLMSERDSSKIEKSALEQAKEQSRLESDRFRAENRVLKAKIDEISLQKSKISSEQSSVELEAQSKLQAASSKMRGELDEVRVALANAQNKTVALENLIQALSTENASLKASDTAQSQHLLKDLQSKAELIERLVGDNENTKQRYHRKELALLELLNEKEEALKRTQLETVQLTTSSWSFRRRSRGDEKGGSTHKQIS